MSNREEYVEKMKAQLDQWNAEIAKWEVRAAEAQATARADLDKRLEMLREHREQAMYQMNLLQHLRSKHNFNITLNSDERIDPAKVLRRFEYHHPIFTVRRTAAQSRHHELINVNRTSFCGAYWGNGFHEDGVVSALRVCESLMTKELPA